MTENTNQWIERSRRGDREAFAEIVGRYQGMVSAVTLNVVGDYAQSEDLAQETFLTVWRKLPELREPEKLAAWIYGIARRTALNWTEKQRRNPLREAAELDEAVDPRRELEEARKENEQSLELIWSTVRDLPESLREPLLLYYRYSKSAADIAESLNLTEDAVCQRLSRGRKLLKAEVEKRVESVLEATRPDTAFTVAVMAALGASLVSTTVQAATTTSGAVTVGTGGAATGKAVGIGSLWLIFGPLFYFVWMFSIVFISQWILAQNAPTLRARRYRVYSFFWNCQYFVPYIVLMVLLAVFAVMLAGSSGSPANGAVAFFATFIPGLGTGILLGFFNRKRVQTIIKEDLGLSEKHVESYDYVQTEHRLYLSLAMNAVFLGIAFFAALTAPFFYEKGSWLTVAVTLCVGALFTLTLYAYYLFGRHLLTLCRSQASMVEYPPLVDDPFEVVLDLKMKAPAAIDHRKEAGRLYWFTYLIWLGFAGPFVWFLGMLHWDRHPLLTGLCVFGLVAGFGFQIFLNKRIREKKNLHLLAAVMGLYCFCLAFVLETIECDGLSLQKLRQIMGVVTFDNMAQLMLLLFMIFNLFASAASVVFWLHLKFAKTEKAKTDGGRLLREAIDRYRPDNME